MSSWERFPTVGSGGWSVFRRELPDRHAVYVEYEANWESEGPLLYSWSVQDSSCGRVLDSGHIDGEEGLAGAQRIADAAAAQLFPGC